MNYDPNFLKLGNFFQFSKTVKKLKLGDIIFIDIRVYILLLILYICVGLLLNKNNNAIESNL
ncbi:hypothetical protein BpHYR1_011562 [Brachionus plicatilis]|uniref:Uncharacterized protein n=1 Tax=Brachionus plicatilis TaxID=10195 RepID=A0A3M7SRB9_BRAPC|nr:hypothetical protein BpHYR1_011562 [Brachionus plicatilis]